ncbi:sensor histidine kinase [Myroides injenensis]|uniref:sensor histidine kinase n=1 Tax=Myroides injenensis TaxID=1183151 RepID=UPI0002D49235|nr:HAMP domain-containing sensor histidine kinase [Myroides injenensis]
MMYSKSKYYLTAFCLFYLLLLGVICYYFYNAYQLKEKSLITEVHTTIDAFEETPAFRKIEVKKDNELYKELQKLIIGKVTLDEIKQSKQTFIAKNNNILSHCIDSIFAPTNYDVAIKYVVTSIYLIKEEKELLESPFTVMETNNKVVTTYKINTSTWEVENSSVTTDIDDAEPDYNHHFIISQSQYTDIKNINKIIFLSLAPLLISSILICIFILLLYYITYKTIKQKEEEVVSLHNMVDNLTHEFKLPIATLKYGCANLEKEYDSPTIALLKRQIDRLDRLQTTLTSDKVEDHTYFSKEDFFAIEKDFRLNFSDVSFSFEWKNNEKEIPFSKTSIETLLLNIIENGAKYGGTAINCTLLYTKNKIEITINDNGIGIEAKQQQHIFKKFYRVIYNNVHTTKGLGIGLYQVQQIVKSLKGTITIDSKLNIGTTFKITLRYV